MKNKEVVATKTEGKLFHLLNDGNVTDEGGLTVCNCSNMFVSKKKSVLNADHLVKCWNENEELKAINAELLEALKDLSKYCDNLFDAPNHGTPPYISKSGYLFNDLIYYNIAAKEAIAKATK